MIPLTIVYLLLRTVLPPGKNGPLWAPCAAISDVGSEGAEGMEGVNVDSGSVGGSITV